MTQYQPPHQSPGQPQYQVPYAQAGGYSVPAQRPASITALSIVSIVLGSLGLICNGSNMVLQVLLLAGGGRNPMMPSLPAMTNSALNAYGAASMLIATLLSGVALAGGIGGLKLSPLARRTMVVWAAVTLGWVTVNLIVQLVWVVPAMADYTQQIQSRQAGPQITGAGVAKAMQISGAIVSWLAWCVLPVFFLVFWRSPKVVAAFDGESPDAPSSPPMR